MLVNGEHVKRFRIILTAENGDAGGNARLFKL